MEKKWKNEMENKWKRNGIVTLINPVRQKDFACLFHVGNPGNRRTASAQ